MSRGRIVIESDSDEKEMINWLKKKKDAVIVIDSDCDSPSVKEPAAKRPRKEDKFKAERTMMQSFLMAPSKAASAAPASAPASSTKQILTSAADFFKAAPLQKVVPPVSSSSPTSKENRVTTTAPTTVTPSVSPVAKAAMVTGAMPKAKAVEAASKTGLPWEDKSVVLTGVLSGVTREDAVDKIQKILGGRVTTAVSSKTAFLVTGALLEDGRPFQEGSKYRKALELQEQGKAGPQILDEDAFFDVLKRYGGDSVLSSYVLPVAQQPPRTTATIMGTTMATTMGTTTMATTTPTTTRSKEYLQWTEKYRPSVPGELVGNTQAVQRLWGWLRDWEDVHVRGQKKAVQFRGSAVENVNAKAALISGPPGIGKSTAAALVCKELGWTVLEFNASDVRGKLAIEEIAAGAATTRGLLAKKTCLVMDEVDGVSDRGGNAALIQLVKKTRIPVICICNDRMDQKVRSLANSCLDIRFARPSRADVVRRVLTVLAAETAPNLKNLTEHDLAELAESVGCDLRQCLNTLQLRASAPAATPEGVGQKWGKLKDAELMQTPFDATKVLLTSSMARNLSLSERVDLAFIDYDLVPLLIQQNYARCVEKAGHDRRAIEAVARASKYIAYADRISAQLRSSNDWSLLPDVVMMGSVAPAFACNNVLAFPEFPAYLGRLSTANKNLRLARELKTMLGQRISGREVAKSGVVEVVYRRLMTEIKAGNIDQTVAMLNELEIPKDALTEHITELRCLPAQIDEYKDIDSKLKAALTRAYNASAQRLRVPPADFAKAKRQGGGGDGDGEGEGEGEAGESSDDDSKPTVGGLIKQAKPKAAAAKAKAKAKANAKA